MRRITMWVVATVCGLVLLFSYRTSLSGPGAAAAGTGTAAGAGPPGIVSAANDPSTAPSGTAPATGTSPAPAPAGNARNVTVNGTVAQTRWGPVQVQVHITSGKIVDVVALQVPDGNGRDYEINSYAVPQLHDEVLAAQSANIDTVSGATVTSDGYRESLQSALDTAHFTG